MKIIDISIRRRVTIAMFTLAIILFGVVSFLRLKVNLLPELTYPTLTIRTDHPGAAPAEIENLISKPIEEALGVVKNVNQIRSISRSGQSDVILEFEWGTDMDYAGLEVREKLDALELPLDVRRPSILRFDPSLEPIVRFAFYREDRKTEEVGKDTGLESGSAEMPESNTVAGQQISSLGADRPGASQPDLIQPGEWFDEEELKFLRRFAEEEIKKELETAIGVAAVKLSGGLEEEIQILVDQGRLSQLGIPINELSRQVGLENVNLSGGRLKEGTHQYLVRILNQFQSLENIEDIVLSTENGKPIHLKDIARIKHGYSERTAITRFNQREAVEIAIYQEGDANTVSVVREINKKLRRVREIIPEGYRMDKFYDQSIFISQAVNEVIQAGIIGGILAILILYLFLQNFWSTVIISLSIPVSVIATFNLMYGADLTLNIMSLGGIALGIGMLLDNSIVVLENIARHRDKGKDTKTAVRDGASEVGTAVTASTLTTIAVFLPLVFVKGIGGQLFKDQALTVTFALLISLFVALTLIPMLASLVRKDEKPAAVKEMKTPQGGRIRRLAGKTGHFLFSTIPTSVVKLIRISLGFASRVLSFIISPALKLFKRFYNYIENKYHLLLKWSLNHRGAVISTAVVIFLATMALVPRLGIELIPQLSQGEFRIEFKLPPGTPLEKTDDAIAEVQKEGKKIDQIENLFSVAGSGNRMDVNPEQGGENWGELSVNLIPRSSREDEERVMEKLRESMQNIPDLQYKFYRPTLFTFKTPVEVEIAGYDLRSLRRLSVMIANRLESSLRFADIKTTMKSGHPEIQIRFDRERAAMLGFAVHEIADRIVAQIRGDVATRYLRRDYRIDVRVRAREDARNSISKIRSLIINPESEHPVTLDAVADVIVDMGPAEIRRVDQERVALVTANLNYGDLGSAVEEINRIIGSLPIPGGVSVQITGQNREMTTSFRSLRFALLLAIFLVYLIMASQFESFLHPFVILFTIPLALVGAVLGLYITASTVSVVVLIGLILLAGIVVNNAIVLIDLINKLRAEGTKKTEAIIQGGLSRLRPIMMTTLTTTLALLPLALGIGEGAEIRAPMAITVIGGLTVSTLLTLVVIPVVYSVLDRKEFPSKLTTNNSDVN
jgi:HAE1 family hydrophobic/amphiphilic exporter-1